MHYVNTMQQCLKIIAFLFVCGIGLLLPLLFCSSEPRSLRRVVAYILITLILQLALGVGILFSMREPYTTSMHVLGGAVLLSFTVLLALRAYPLKGGS